MSLGLRLSLLPLLIAGCAAQRLEVPDSDWETVPAPQRAAVDRQLAADLAAAQAELKAATAGLAELQRTLPKTFTASPAAAPHAAPAPPQGHAATKPAAAGDEWATAMRDHEHARVDALGRVEASKTAWLRADLSWRELRLAAANEALAMIVYKRELVRAQAIDHNLPGTDSYNVAPLRGQFSQAQQRWYSIESRARQARTTFERASATLASDKEAYAQLMRGIPMQSSVVVADDHPPSLTLTGWAVTRADIRRRRGLRRFLDDAANAPPQLRKVALRLTVRAVPAATVPPAVSTGAPAAETHGNTPPPAAPAGMHPADAAAAGLSTGISAPDAAGKQAGHPLPPAPAPSGSPSTPAGIATSGKPAAAPQGTTANAKSAPGAPQASSPTTTASAGTKPGLPASAAAALPATSKPAPTAAQAGPPVAAGNAVARPASPTSPTSANAKPKTATATTPPATKPID